MCLTVKVSEGSSGIPELSWELPAKDPAPPQLLVF